MEGLYSCLDYFQAVDDPFSKQLQADYSKKFPDTKYLFTAGSRRDRHVSRHQVLRGRGQGDQRRAAPRGGGGRDGQRPSSTEGPGGGAEMVPGKMHCKMNMYIAVVQGRRRQDPLRGHRQSRRWSIRRSAERRRIRTGHGADAYAYRTAGGTRAAFRRVLPGGRVCGRWSCAAGGCPFVLAERPDLITLGDQRPDPVAARDQLRPVLGLLRHHDLRPGVVLRRGGLCHRAGRPGPRFQPALGRRCRWPCWSALLLAAVFAAFLLLGPQAADHHLRGLRHAHRLVCGRAAGLGLAVCRRRQRPLRRSSCCSSAATNSSRAPSSMRWRWRCCCWSMPARRYLVRSQLGLVLAGMRQNEERLAFFGYRVQVFKALVFSLRRHGRRALRRALQLPPGLDRNTSRLTYCYILNIWARSELRSYLLIVTGQGTAFAQFAEIASDLKR